mmetsp:Transcript_25561/g.50340  ORF Transcript_25561/g.50340 Transcript_25561/m.50340 type:complete len:200 (+) Transcript_25561:3016-3615(+)
MVRGISLDLVGDGCVEVMYTEGRIVSTVTLKVALCTLILPLRSAAAPGSTVMEMVALFRANTSSFHCVELTTVKLLIGGLNDLEPPELYTVTSTLCLAFNDTGSLNVSKKGHTNMPLSTVTLCRWNVWRVTFTVGALRSICRTNTSDSVLLSKSTSVVTFAGSHTRNTAFATPSNFALTRTVHKVEVILVRGDNSTSPM